MKVLGIGNAIVDVICKVEENFITKNKQDNVSNWWNDGESKSKKFLYVLSGWWNDGNNKLIKFDFK